MKPLALPSSTLHDDLRQATASRHRKLDAALGAAGYFDDRASYCRFLERAWQFQSAMELALERAGAPVFIPDWARRRRAPLLERDLAALEVQLPSTAISHPTLLVARDEAAVLGSAYVLEGATLGGKVLLSRIAPMGFHATHGGAYLNGYGPAHGALWRAFLERLAARDAAGISRSTAMAAACEVFDLAAAIYGAEVAS